MDLSGVINALASESITVTRRTNSYNAQGVLVQNAPTTIGPMNVVVEPVLGKDLRRIPSGQRSKGSIKVLTPGLALLMGAPGQLSDELTWKGELYDVVHVADWTSYGYGDAVLVKREV